MTAGSGWEPPGRQGASPIAAGLVAALVVVGVALALMRPGAGELAFERRATPPAPESLPQPPGTSPASQDDGDRAAPDAPGGPHVGHPGSPPPPGEGWRWLPAPPIGARVEPLSAWTGEEFVVWGGTVHGDPVVVGAAYEPRRNRWRRLRDAPVAMSAANSAAAWTGDDVVVWGGRRDETVAAAYDPAVDRWRTLPAAPVATTGSPPTVTWTGREVLVWSTVGAAYDPAADRWRPLPVPRMADGAASDGTHVAVWADDPRCDGCGSLFVWAAPADASDAWPGAAYDAASGRWSEIATADLPLGGAGLTATWTGEAVVLCCTPGGGAALAVYDPAADAWQRPVDGPVAGRTLHTSRWIGGELLVWGGRQDRDRWSRGNGAIWDPGTGRWRWVAEASPRIPRQLHAAVWTGDELLIWGGYDGRQPRGDGAALDPAPPDTGDRPEPPPREPDGRETVTPRA